MKTEMKKKMIISGIFMATLSAVSASVSTHAATGVPPVVLKAAGPAAAPPAPSKKSAKKIDPTELTDDESRIYSFAFKNIEGIDVDKTESPTANSRWREPLDIGGVLKYVSNDQNQAMDFFGPYEDGSAGAVTYNKIQGQATFTEFLNKKPISYTVMNKRGEYTATPGFCKLLAFQTNSKDFTELAERAVTCKAFSDRTVFDDSVKAAMQSTIQSHLNSHRRNLSYLADSVAKPMVDAATKRDANAKDSSGIKAWAKEQSWIRLGAGLVGKDLKPNGASDPLKKMNPRNVLTANGNAGEVEDRAVLFDLAEACGKLWKNGDDVPAATGTSKAAAGTATKN